MQSTHKISGAAARGFADYLTASARRGDYYVGGELEGEGGAWHGAPDALADLGVDPDHSVRKSDLVTLMEGRSPRTGEPIRRVGGDGSRVAGVDMTFSAPKSVSALWAVSDPYRRAQIEVAHRKAVASALARVEREVPVVRRREAGALRQEPARSLVAAEFVHTSSRLTRDQERDGVPDPQLHSHVVVVAAQREDGRFAAVDSRELFRSQRVNGAWYRAELADELRGLGVHLERRTGREGRFFEVAGVPDSLAKRWSRRREVIDRAAREFRERYGRAPRAGELAGMAVATRGTKTATAEVDVSAAWRAVGEEYGLTTHARRACSSPVCPSASRTFAASCSATLSRSARWSLARSSRHARSRSAPAPSPQHKPPSASISWRVRASWSSFGTVGGRRASCVSSSCARSRRSPSGRMARPRRSPNMPSPRRLSGQRSAWTEHSAMSSRRRSRC